MILNFNFVGDRNPEAWASRQHSLDGLRADTVAIMGLCLARTFRFEVTGPSVSYHQLILLCINPKPQALNPKPQTPNPKS